MTGIILSLLVTLAALMFAFHSDDPYDRTGRRMQENERRICRKPGDILISVQADSKKATESNLIRTDRLL
jgi:hypothetical protein